MNDLILWAQEYVKKGHPDSVEIAGFIAWVSTNKFDREMHFTEALDLVEGIGGDA